MKLNWHYIKFSFTVILWTSLLQAALVNCTRDPVPDDEPLLHMLENEEFQSQLLHQPVRYAVLLPENYYASTDSFPVVYLLHGFGDNYTAWYKGGSIRYFADNLASDIVPMIFVMIDGFKSYYVNNYSGSFRYMDMVTSEFVPEIDAQYRTLKSKSQRAVMGYSMGGYGALILPAMHPDIFGVSVPLSMSFRTDEQYISESQDGWNYQWGSVFGGSGTSGTERLTRFYMEHSPFHFFDQPDISAFNNIKFQIHCGDDEESLHIPSGEMHNIMRQRGIDHEFRVGDGGHSWNYWHNVLPEALIFISKAFEGIAYPENPEPINLGEIIPDKQYTLRTLGGTTLNMGVFTPDGYDSSGIAYPALFFLHNYQGSERVENVKNTLSLLNNKMRKGFLPKSLIIEIPLEDGEITVDMMTGILEDVSANFRILADKKSRVLLANGEGGLSACKLLPAFMESFNACFFYNASLPGVWKVAEGIYYYVDVTDKSEAYRENFNLYISLREENSEYEYRVRQGKDDFQAFLNGLDASVRYISRHLK